MKKILLVFVITAAAGLGVAYYFNWFGAGGSGEISSFEECVAAGYPVMESYPRQCRAGNRTFVETIPGPQPKLDDRVRLAIPSVNAVVESPLVVEGEARGTWYFEASFPISLEDAAGRELGLAVAQAQGEWMTENFVPFRAVLNFDPPTTDTGTLILHRDNPSGLPEHDASVEIPVRFKKASAPQNSMTVRIFFGSEGAVSSFDCAEVSAVERVIERTPSPARAALEELFKGPTGSEVKAGYFTSINPGVKIQSLTITSGVAKADFSAELEAGVAGSCKVAAIRAQIEETLKQFPTVKSVIISINGRTEDILQP